MNEHTSRRRAVTQQRGPRTASRYLAFVAMALAAVVMTAGILNAEPAQGQVSKHYARLWDGISDKNKRWARRTSRCESGGNTRIHGSGGTYHGAFQFVLSTWRRAPKSPGGDPHRYGWRTQAVVAVYLKKRDGAGHWGSCG